MPLAEDDKDLRSLVIGHYVAAGGSLLVGLVYTAFALLMATFMQAASRSQNGSAEDAAAARLMGSALSAGAVLIGIYFLLIVGSLIIVGRFLSKRQRYRDCLRLSALNATSLMFYSPFGPGAAAFTYNLLRRPSVQEQFGDTSYPHGPDTRGEWDLKATSTACYVFAVFQAASAIPGMGMAGVMANMPVKGTAEQAEAFHLLFVVLMAVLIAGMTALYVLLLGMLGYFLAKGRYRRICMGLCVPLLLSFPLGTLIAVGLLILLSRPDIKTMFEGPPSEAIVGTTG